MAPQSDSQMKVSALLRAGHKVCEVANLVRVSRTTVDAIKKRMDNAKVSTDVQAVIGRLLWIVAAWNAIRRIFSNGILQAFTIQNSLPGTACRSVDIFAIVHVFLYHVDGGGWMHLYLFICLSAGAVEWESSCFATTLLHHASLKVTSVLVLFVIFGGLF